jgi:hypothetical protein
VSRKPLERAALGGPVVGEGMEVGGGFHGAVPNGTR